MEPSFQGLAMNSAGTYIFLGLRRLLLSPTSLTRVYIDTYGSDFGQMEVTLTPSLSPSLWPQ